MADIPGMSNNRYRNGDSMSEVQYSGVADLLQADGFQTAVAGRGIEFGVGGKKVAVLRSVCHRPNEAGMVSVHCQVTTLNPDTVAVGNNPNTRILAKVTWQTGRGGGNAIVDITRGGVFSIGGAHSVQVDVYRRINDPAAATPSLTHLVEKRIECTVHWSTSISPKAAMVTTDTVTLDAAAASAFIDIPPQAQSVIVQSDTFAALALTILGAHIGKTAAAAYQTTNPFTNGTPIVHGAEALKITNGSAFNGVKYVPTFELWL